MPEKIIAVDICNTLFDSNTTFDFINYCISEEKLKRGVGRYKLLKHRKLPLFWLLAFMQRVTKHDYHKAEAVRLLKNVSSADVNIWAKEFFNSYLFNRKIPAVFRLLNTLPKHDVVLISSTIEPVANVIANGLGYKNFIATKLALDKEIYTGEIAAEISGIKLDALQNWLNKKNLQIHTVITDNSTDKELMSKATHKYAVCYNRKQEQHWMSVPGVHILRIGYQD